MLPASNSSDFEQQGIMSSADRRHVTLYNNYITWRFVSFFHKLGFFPKSEKSTPGTYLTDIGNESLGGAFAKSIASLYRQILMRKVAILANAFSTQGFQTMILGLCFSYLISRHIPQFQSPAFTSMYSSDWPP